jgi:ABC-type transporter Mla maintaining outer membrane lipid asymmetry permease subunit MlaE
MMLWGDRWIAEWLEGLGRLTLLAKRVIASLSTFKVAWRGLLYQTCFLGVKSQSAVLIKGAFTGMVLGAQNHCDGVDAPGESF